MKRQAEVKGEDRPVRACRQCAAMGAAWGARWCGWCGGSRRVVVKPEPMPEGYGDVAAAVELYVASQRSGGDLDLAARRLGVESAERLDVLAIAGLELLESELAELEHRDDVTREAERRRAEKA